MLKDQVDKKKYIDVGSGVETQLGVTRTRLDTSIAVLKEEGYSHFKQFKVPQTTQPGQFTTMKYWPKRVLPLLKLVEIEKRLDKLHESSTDHGRSFLNSSTILSL